MGLGGLLLKRARLRAKGEGQGGRQQDYGLPDYRHGAKSEEVREENAERPAPNEKGEELRAKSEEDGGQERLKGGEKFIGKMPLPREIRLAPPPSCILPRKMLAHHAASHLRSRVQDLESMI